MFPGFVHMYKDNEGFIHLYFFNGINDKDDYIYQDIDLSNIPFKYICNKESDYIKDYKFFNKTIVKIKCNLVEIESGKTITKILSL